ncbi:hypothetical protein HC028_00705 [Planosporangium flavigriseum]|uniref:Uncharacterized protein n=1 Tax=Planosporangium flavigriseum TaxID=373681 RepID=A0A8J3LT22_9ACTN|nr:hypothetical protein [Planosporangium flavigriseum]NJC63042.1 hypothetical protein [Planosporangium flavigriseum]GIG73086.1 hypothetical protein Pfl04_14900 [Planosporangium flavigriseum]
MTLQSHRTRANLVPNAYRGVSVSHARLPLDPDRLREHFLGREAYRRTRFLVVRDDAGGTALLRVEKESEAPLFSPIVEVEVLATPDECAYVVAPEADTAVPSTLARIAVERAPEARAVVVEGRYEHVSFIVNPKPLRLLVQEVVPPTPAKLFDQVQRLLAVAEDLPPILPVPDVITFEELAAQAPSPRYLLPCSGSGVAVAGAATAYLDQRPPAEPWTLLGCERSQGIHEWFYGERPPTVEMCPRQRGHQTGTAVLTKCCLLEDRIEREDGRVVVPWGASLDQVRDALREVALMWEPEWRPV